MIALERREGRPLRIGHRGAAALAPENTLRSFRAALEAGVDLIELDVLALPGGRLVVAHSRQEAGPAPLTLEEALAFFAEEATETGLQVDLKSPRAALRVAELLRSFGLRERALVSSFHLGALRALRQGEPGLRTALTFPRSLLGLDDRGRLAGPGLLALRAVLPALVGPLLAAARARDLALHHAVVSAAAVRRAHARGAAVLAWTVDEPEELARVEAAGVDAVITNDPAIFGSTLRA